MIFKRCVIVWYLDIPDEKLDEKLPPYFHPGKESPEYQYMMERRSSLGGSVPKRRAISKPLPQPDDSHFEVTRRGFWPPRGCHNNGLRSLAKDLTKVEGLGSPNCSDHPDEARTFGMDSLFPTMKNLFTTWPAVHRSGS